VCGSEEGHCEKRCGIQGGGQELAVMANDNSGEFVLPSPRFIRIWHQIHLNCHYYNFTIIIKNFYHYPTITAISWLSP